jgi:hypothetical protein
MPPSFPVKAVAIEVVAAEPTDADRAAIAHLSARERKSIAPVTYLVKVRFDIMPEPTSQGWALYVGDFRVPKYWATQDGIYFKVFDPQFLEEHEGEPLRFSQNGIEFIDTGLTLTAPTSHDATRLPLQDELLR